jgi:release factor glutamine methyltransferase
MTVQEATTQLGSRLFPLYGEREAALIADWVVEKITGWTKIDRVIGKTVSLSADQRKLYDKYTRELLQQRPVQYVLQEAWFYGMKLYVDENVLIPRPETEELVSWVIEEVEKMKTGYGNNSHNAITLLDIGTGSGCIPLALKKKLPLAEVHSCDISDGALAVARKNAREQVLDLVLHRLNFLGEAERNRLPVFDVMVSNPPYVPVKDKEAMAAHVLRYEPHIALFVNNNDPLLFYEAIGDFAKTHLVKGGAVFVEIHEALGQEVVDLFKRKGASAGQLKKDLQGKDRMVRALF